MNDVCRDIALNDEIINSCNGDVLRNPPVALREGDRGRGVPSRVVCCNGDLITAGNGKDDIVCRSSTEDSAIDDGGTCILSQPRVELVFF